jgi:hypothetical protein
MKLYDDESRGTNEASSPSSSRSTVLGKAPESGYKKLKGSSADAPMKDGGNETILQEKERIAGRSRAVHMTKKAVPADDYKLSSGRGDKTILQEKERIAGRRSTHTKMAVPANNFKLPSSERGDETILQEKERIAGCSRVVHRKKAFSVDDYSLTGGGDDTILHLDSEQVNTRAFRISDKNKEDDISLILDSDQANPGAFGIGGQDNDDDSIMSK